MAPSGTKNDIPGFSVDRLVAVSKSAPEDLPHRLEAFDRLEVRLHPGELALVAARTGHSKTTMLVNMVHRHLHSESGEGGLMVFYSFDESEVSVFHRLACLATTTGDARIPWTPTQVRDYLRDAERAPSGPSVESLEAALERLRAVETRLLVVDRSGWKIGDVLEHMRATFAQRQGIVLLDYLELARCEESVPGRPDIEACASARKLKLAAQELKIPVIAGKRLGYQRLPDDYYERLSQAGTYAEAKEVIREARPGLDDIREDGTEQEADLVIGLLDYGADFAVNVSGRAATREVPLATLLEVGVLKHRYGPIGRWASLAREGATGLVRDVKREGEV